MNVRELSVAELADVAGDVPFVRWGVGVGNVARAWTAPQGGPVAVERYRRAYGTSLTVVGDGDAALRVAARLAPRLDVGSVTLPRAAVVPDDVAFGPGAAGVRWEWMWTDAEPEPVPGEDRVVELDAGSPAVRSELAAFLAVNSPRHSAEPDDEHARCWLGVRAPDGEPARVPRALPGGARRGPDGIGRGRRSRPGAGSRAGHRRGRDPADAA